MGLQSKMMIINNYDILKLYLLKKNCCLPFRTDMLCSEIVFL